MTISLGHTAPFKNAMKYAAVGLSALLLTACDNSKPANTGTDTAGTAQTDVSTSANPLDFSVPVSYHKLDNGLKVVLSPDPSIPTTTIAVYYNIGFRIEPKDRTGFAHLFEHMMFQGTPVMPKGKFDSLINNNGGVLNGSTRFDYTNYFEIVPAHMTKTVLWAEADRMRHLDLNQASLENQQGVVKNEVKVNVINRPYGGFPWLDLPQLANENWYNAHNFYGDLADLDAATLEDVKTFFDQYYAPNNAVLVVAGDINKDETLGWVTDYFGDIPAAGMSDKPDISEPRQAEEKKQVKYDKLAPQPALGLAYHVPARGTDAWYAMAIIDQLLIQGDDSLLNQRLIKEKGYGNFITGGINWPLGNLYNYNGPMLWSAFMIHGNEHATSTIMQDIDSVVTDLQTNLISDDDITLAKTKIKSALYDALGDGNRVGLIDMLASLALFDDDPTKVNELLQSFDKVTPELVRQTAKDYLRTTNRSVIELKPGNGPADTSMLNKSE